MKISNKKFNSRLILGTARYPNPQIMLEALESSGTEMITVSIRRLNLKSDYENESILNLVDRDKYFLLPNTAGCFTAKDAVFTAQLSREALNTNWIKLEVIGDNDTLFPDVPELLKAAAQLVSEGFVVLPYCSDDPVACKKLADIGCAAVMPLGAPIGSGMGIRNPYNLQIIRDMVQIPIIVDAGVGTASDASFAMELGMDGVLMNSAVAGAQDPLGMAKAMRLAVEAGRLAFESGRIPRRLYASASSPVEGIVSNSPFEGG